MAANASERYKYRFNTGAVNGSIAYDLNSPELWPEYEYAPVDIPAADEREDAVVAGKHLASAQAISPVAVVGFAIAAVLLVFSLLARAQLTAVSGECVQLETSLAQLQDSRSKLLIAYESAFNLTEIEDFAMGTLGMQKPRGDQVFYIAGEAQDRAVVLGSAGENVGVADKLGDFFSLFTSYFRKSAQ